MMIERFPLVLPQHFSTVRPPPPMKSFIIPLRRRALTGARSVKPGIKGLLKRKLCGELCHGESQPGARFHAPRRAADGSPE